MFNTYKAQNFIGTHEDFDLADIILFGAPFDGTTSFRPGTRFAPNQIRVDSYGLETYSPYLNLDLENMNICDIGDIEFPFGNPQKVLDDISEVTKTVVNHNKKTVMIGGEHLVSLGAIKILHEKYPNLKIIHFDAHADLRDDYMGEKLSHASIMKRVWDLVGDDKIYQFGIRSGTKSEFDWAKAHTTLRKFDTYTLVETIDNFNDTPVYLTIDLDVLDPSIFSGTGTPEPGGITMKEMLDAIVALSQLNIVGADIVELSPHYDTSGVSTAVACKIIREVLLILAQKKL
ncbi:MAG: agmatinase [Epulopiscium sp. Nuni2H_MBin003]|nr:MAG: agmatinase [Epulopiscium sp. Nuni2H_MBin003]